MSDIVTDDIVKGDDDLSKRMKAAGMFTIEQMMDDEVSGLGIFDTHAGVHTFEDVCEWVDRKRLEYTRMRVRHELREDKGDELYEWVLAHSAAFTCISKHLRKVKSKQAAQLTALREENERLTKRADKVEGAWNDMQDGYADASIELHYKNQTGSIVETNKAERAFLEFMSEWVKSRAALKANKPT